eukprot:TRINITY_DN45728_c0_g1_i1.p1 TRINITY_DN45728_c0_g1~~TRINITY_DN45728_c0_g1_i1.p1  ORF type:complete len:242 (-),score=96.52 TRINITY_DN45728_c0_g1_i1:168-863(-)
MMKLVLIALAVVAVAAAPAAALDDPVSSSQQLNVTLYYESLCPDCKEFISTQLFPFWNTTGSDKVISVTLVPYGNAQERQVGNTWKFTCQHGPDECAGNFIETCAIDLVKDLHAYFPFIHCVEQSDDLPSESAPRCAKLHQLSWQDIENCVNSPRAAQLEHEMAVATPSSHQYVPWVTVNGQHSQAAENDFVSTICQMYQGPTPPACRDEAFAQLRSIADVSEPPSPNPAN